MDKIIIPLTTLFCLITPMTACDRATEIAELTKPSATSTIIRVIERTAVENGVDKKVAVKIAECESGWRQFENDGKLLRGSKNPQDVGIFQVNEKYHLQASRDQGIDIYTAKGNIDYAVGLMAKEGVTPWDWSKDCWSKK